MDFLHTYLLDERPVVVPDAAPSADVQSRLREAAHSRHSLADTGLTVPYFLDSDALMVTGKRGGHSSQSSNPNLFLANASAVLLEAGTPRRGIACGSQLVIALGENPSFPSISIGNILSDPRPGTVARIDVVLRPPPASAMTCLSLTSVSVENRTEAALNAEFPEETAAELATAATGVAEGRWTDTSCIHTGKDTRCDSTEQGEVAADGSLRQEWEVAIKRGEVLFVPEGWELSMLQPTGTRDAGTLAVATVPFGWEDVRRNCC